MFSSLYANIVYPLLASVLVIVIRYDRATSIPVQVAAAGTDFCVLAMGATAGVLGNPRLAEKWGAVAELQVGLSLGVFSAILAAVSVKIPATRLSLLKQAKINFALGLFALALVSVVNIVAEW